MTTESKTPEFKTPNEQLPSFQELESDPVEQIIYGNVLQYCKYNNIKLTHGHDYDNAKIAKVMVIQSHLMLKGITTEFEMVDGIKVEVEMPLYIFIFGQKSTTTGKTAFGGKADDINSIMNAVDEKKVSLLFISEAHSKAM